jgi:sugar (pentulose or hexulose) kinase
VTDTLIVVLDVGKTMAKLSLWTSAGSLIARETRPNQRIDTGAYVGLDAGGIEAWMGDGAAAAIVRDGAIVQPPLDYEEPVPAAERELYDAGRDAFAHTGSPSLADGLNLGAQLHRLEAMDRDLLSGDALILLWPQYWAWRLSGVAASEVTSLGCHTDLWRPIEARFSDMAIARGWAAHFPPLKGAGEALGAISAEWVERCGLPAGVQVHCGLHDSNAALLAARGFAEIAEHESTVLSTGTWFIAMRSPASAAGLDLSMLSEARDCLINVDAFGKPIPSARFMGGREIELLTGIDTRRIDIKPDQPALVAAVPEVLASGARVLPAFAPGFGPFPHHKGRWINMPQSHEARRAAVCLYAALMTNISLNLIGARERILVEGRFAEAEVFVRALASLRPHDEIYVSHAHNDVSYGALRLLDPSLKPTSALVRVQPLDVSLKDYSDAWRREVERLEHAL